MDILCPTFEPGKYTASRSISRDASPIRRKMLNPPGYRRKGRPREYTHTRMGIHEDIYIEREKKRYTWPTLVVSAIKLDAVYLNQKI
jgi:hypothetical protein